MSIGTVAGTVPFQLECRPGQMANEANTYSDLSLFKEEIQQTDSYPTMAFHPQKLLLHLLHWMTTIFLFLIIPCASPLSFNYNDFSKTNNEAITTTGLAKILGSQIRLTQNLVDDWGRATYSETMHLWEKNTRIIANFTTNFSFIITSQGAENYSDGITFFLASPHFPEPDPTDGAGIGLVSTKQMNNSSFIAANKFVAVEFDTFRNEWDPPAPVFEHVGININNLTSRNTTKWNSVIKENRTYNSTISYDSSTLNLSVSFTGFSSNDHIPIEQHLSSIVDLRDYLPERVEFGFSAGTGHLSELHILCSWSFESTDPQPQPSKIGLVVGLSVGACLLIMGLGLFWLMNRKNNRDRGGGDQDLAFDLSMDDEFERGTGPKKFSNKDLVRATNNFAEENKLGEGGFGGVYKGFLREMNLYVAVKRVSRGSRQGIKEYASEVKSISRLRHKNLVQLIGWCHQNKDLLLIYEFMPNGSLDSHLFKGKSLLTWGTRYNIAQGLASALLYLHEEWEQCVLHRDIKSSNIMLDSSFNAKLGDFGLARMVEHAKGSQTTALAGTMGYLAPECVISGRTSKESDIYSFGIVTLEIACGRKAIETKAKEDEIILLEWVWELYGRGKLLDAADAKLCGEFDEQQMERLMIVGLWCGHPDYSLRPSIRKALHVLDFEAPLPIDLAPKMPVPTYVAPSGRASTSSTTISSTASSSTSALLYSQPVN